MLEAAVPTLGFTLTYLPTRELELALGVGLSAAVLLLAIRLVQRSSPQFVLNSIVGIAIAAAFALRSVGWLGATKLALGWPLQVGALAAMVWLLARGHTPLAASAEVTAERLGGEHPGPHLHPLHEHPDHEHPHHEHQDGGR